MPNRKLTRLQQWVYDLDTFRVRPRDIAKATGLTIKRVDNIKRRLRAMGYETTRFRDNSAEGTIWIEDSNDW